MADEVVVRQPGEGDAYWALGGLFEMKAKGAETGGQITIVEATLRAGQGPPPHKHDSGEAVYVLSGRIAYNIGDDRHEGGPGSFFYVPAEVWENFEPIEDSRILMMYIPGGQESFFAEAGEPATSRELPPPDDAPPDVERLAAVAARYGMVLKPPAAV
jgi:quercetin dioxygenase-like cupin family protein